MSITTNINILEMCFKIIHLKILVKHNIMTTQNKDLVPKHKH